MRVRGWMMAVAALIVGGTASAGPACRVVRLTCDQLTNPLGIDDTRPQLSWQLDDSRRGARQTAYRILVASRRDLLAEGKADLWDSRKVASDRSVLLTYAGKPLDSRRRCWWKVRVWDMDGKPSPYSDAAWWEMGLLAPADWTAQWIGRIDPAAPKTIGGPAQMLRKPFSLDKPIQSARAYVTALGSYRLTINGKRVGEDILTPDWTDYRKRVSYQTYDVTGLLQRGENVMGALLGDGWYASGLGWALQRNCFGPPPSRLLLQMRLRYADGTETTVVSDGSWKAATSPILRSEIYAGETYDARQEQPGWDRAGFDESKWSPVQTFTDLAPALSAQRSQAIRVTQTLKPKTVTNPGQGVYVFDMGQNMVGWARLTVSGPAGTRVRMRFAEILKPDGNIYTENLRKAEATDTYTLRGGGTETFEPHFTYHGFRYIEMTGYPGVPAVDSITGQVFHTDVPVAGAFTCDSELVNKIVHNINWGLRGNLESVPTDCPQRDERLGWMGDAEIIWMTATYLRDMAAFTHKWTEDVREAQSPAGGYSDVSPRIIDLSDGAPAWGDAGVIVPWTAWRQYGDTRIIEENWDAMERWMDYIHAQNPDLLWEKRRNNDFGDWVPANSETPKDLIATAYWAQDAMQMAQIARAIGNDTAARKYDDLYNGIKSAFITKFVKDDGAVGNGSQTCYALALHVGLLPDDRRAAAVQKLVADIQSRGGHLSTGFIGTAYLMPALTQNGANDTAFTLLLNRTYPSWGYMIEKGATTIWERWNGDTGDPGMNSFNHYAFGAVGEWLYRFAAGIDTDSTAPGFKRIVLRPRFGPGLSHVRAEHDSPYGKIVSEWTRSSDTFRIDCVVPPNTTALVYVPQAGALAVGESIKPLRMEEACAVFQVSAGKHTFVARSNASQEKRVH